MGGFLRSCAAAVVSQHVRLQEGLLQGRYYPLISSPSALRAIRESQREISPGPSGSYAAAAVTLTFIQRDIPEVRSGVRLRGTSMTMTAVMTMMMITITD